MHNVIYKTNLNLTPGYIEVILLLEFKQVKNPTLSFFGPKLDNVKVNILAISYAYDLYEYGRIIDTESFVARAFNKRLL